MASQRTSTLAPVTDLSGVTEAAAESLGKTLGIKTVADLARSPLFTFAAEILSAASEPAHPLRRFGIPRNRVNTAFQKEDVEALADLTISALQGIGRIGERALVKALGVKTVRELGLWPPFLSAREMLTGTGRNGMGSEDTPIYRVSGLVVRSDGSPVTGAAVKIQRQGIRKASPLGKPNSVKTNANGGYVFEYDRPDRPLDLRVQLLPAGTNKKETRPRVITHAGADERVDFVVGDEAFRGLSSFERLERSVAEAVSDEGIEAPEIADFDEETLARLALKAGIDPRTLVLLRQSYALARETQLPAGVLFGMGREKMPLGLAALLVQDPEQRRAAVKAALKDNHIPAHLEQEAVGVLTRLDDLAVAEALKQPATPDATTLGSLLSSAGLPAAKQTNLVEVYVKHTGTNSQFWKEVGTSGVLTEAEIKQVQFTLQLATVAHNHRPMVAALKDRGVADLKALATLAKADWIDLIKGHAGNPPVGLPADLKAAGLSHEDYAEIIFRVVEDALPTAMVAHRADHFPASAMLKRFLARNPDFDLRTTPVRTYLDANPDALDFAAGEDERRGIEKRLKRIERTYRIAPPGTRVETMEVLLRNGDDSATKIKTMGKAAFMRRYEPTLGRERAAKVWTRANNASALATTVVARHSAMFDRTPVHVLPKRVEKVAKFSSHEEMFGSLDFCSCAHCQSVFSPAAYLVDVLHWLDNRPSERPEIAVVSLTIDPADPGSAVCTTAASHGFQAGDVLAVRGADQPEYNGNHTVETVDAGQTHLTFRLTEAPLTDATGNITLVQSALSVLFNKRRADIGQIKLSCTNTNTPLPYIDLVNEALELAVAPVSPSPAYQTTGTAADLRAHPEHLHTGAYAVLAGARASAPDARDAVYPFNLPFNLWIEEARTYLGQLGVSRYRLMDALQGENQVHTDAPVAAETLGMSPLEWDIIAGKPLDPQRTVADFWGLPGDADFVAKLKQVSFFLEQATPPIAENAMEFEELADLLRTDFVQAPAPLGLWFEGQTCDTTRAQFSGLVEPSLDRMHRFIRLRRRLGWSALDLDRAIQVLGGGALDEACLVSMAHVQRLTVQLHQPVAELLNWWGPLDTRRWTMRLQRGVPVGAPAGAEGVGTVFDDQLTEQPHRGEDASPYDRLFQTTSTTAEPGDVFGVRADGDALADETHDLSDHLPAIIGALGVTAEELAELLPLLPDGQLSLANLSALYRHVSLSRALDLKVGDFASLLALTGIDPFEVTHTEVALRFVDEARAVRASGSRIAELDYVLRHRDTRPAALAPDDLDIGVLLFELGNALHKIEVDHPPPDESLKVDAVRQRLVAALELTLAVADVSEALTVIDLETGTPPPAGAEALIKGRLSEIFDPRDARAKLVDQGDPEYLNDRRDRLAYAITAHLRHIAKASAVIERMASAVGLDPAIAAPLLRAYLKHPDGNGRPLLAVFSDDAVRDYPATQASGQPVLPSPTDLPEQFAAFKRLHKTALLLNRLRIRKEEVPWILGQGPARGTLNFQELPVAPNEPAAPYAAWARLRDTVALRDRFSPRDLCDLFEAAAAAEADGTPAVTAAAHEALLSELERRGRWDRADIEFFVGTPARGNTAAAPGALGFTYPGDWRDERPLKRLADIMAAVRRIGLPAETLWPWRAIPLPADGTSAAQEAAIGEQAAQADEIKQAVRARYQEAQWYEVAQSLRNRLRERQRDVLVGWLVGNDARFTDANALFEHFLLDVEMSPCQLTSRIKQAISSVQLFMQRALMGLEVDGQGTPLVELNKADADEWEWMKSYRVWEANRKVFLYPENWIEPELRDDKTPFFRELEDELLQSEITAESAERALRGYLQKLDEVARLEVVGLFHQKDPGADILHVFGRTRGTPPRYFYRQHVDGSRWTPWEKVEVDIGGDHLIPVVFNRRLYLFWPLITESAIEETQRIPPIDSGGDEQHVDSPKRYYQIRLAWSQREGTRWSPKTIATNFIGENIHTLEDLEDDIRKTTVSTPADFFFRAFEEGPDLTIEPIRNYPEGRKSATGYKPLRARRFRLSGCDGTVTLEGRGPEHPPVLVYAPRETKTFNQAFARQAGSLRLEIARGNGLLDKSLWLDLDDGNTLLEMARPPFTLIPPRLDIPLSRSPFFYQDRQRTFFVKPHTILPWIRGVHDWTDPVNVVLDITSNLPASGPPPEPPAPGPWLYDPTAMAALPDRISVAAPELVPHTSDAGPGLIALSPGKLEETFGSRVAFIAGEAVQPSPVALTLAIDSRVVDENGRHLAGTYTGRLPAAARGLGTIVLERTFFQPPLVVDPVKVIPSIRRAIRTRYRFDNFYHPYLCTMMRELNRFGLPGLFDPDPAGPEPLLLRQAKKDEDFFENEYSPQSVTKPLPKDAFDFSYGGSYAIYNWEVFFHIPLLVASRLSDNQRFAEAQQWFHYIFDPTQTDGDTPQRFWMVKPLFDLFLDESADAGPIHELLLLLQYEGSEPEKLKERDELIEQVAEWRASPFNPHALARLRPAAYARTVVMKYVDNLVAWGDQLFRRDSMESINEATQCYILGAQILGRRPRGVNIEPPAPRAFNDLRGDLDAFGNAFVEEEVEGLLPEITETEADVYEDDVAVLGPTLFFCVPPNAKLLSDYWDRIADRLFKIRHCMNIQGVVRQLLLFEPEIDPALLVRAKAAGVDLASALSDVNAPQPLYRYQVLAQKATELCADVRGLGQSLLSALEKKDAEELALLRAGHEVRLQNAILDIREKQIREAGETLESLRRSKENAEIRRDYYRSRLFMNAAEQSQFMFLRVATDLDVWAQVVRLLASTPAPDVSAGTSGFGGTPVVTGTFGGTHMSHSVAAVTEGARILSAIADRAAQHAGLKGSYNRREDDWGLQGDTAEKEIEALDRQIVAAEIRVAVAEKELANLELQLEQSEETEAFLRGKYTNAQLYQWMAGQLSSVYFQSYQLAYDMAKRSERTWQFELAVPEKSFIQFGYWDSLKKGLLAGERLHHDIKRMDVAYLDTNKREYELTRHVSLLELNPLALLSLRQEGKCFVELPEAWFDLDSPGHYMRRIKSMAVSIPSVTGPYTPVRCTLTLLKSSVRTVPSMSNGYARDGIDAGRFVDDLGTVQSVVTSSGSNDSGMFEANLRDERYLPFENAGVVSEWQLDLPANPANGDLRQFDYDTISDVILHIRYTAREGGDLLRTAAVDHVKELIGDAQAAGTVRLFSGRQEFPSAWAKFKDQTPGANERFELALNLQEEHYPFWSQGQLKSVSSVAILARSSEVPLPGSMEIFDKPGMNDATAKRETLERDAAMGDLLAGQLTGGATGIALPPEPVGEIRLFFNDNVLSDLWIAVSWSSS